MPPTKSINFMNLSNKLDPLQLTLKHKKQLDFPQNNTSKLKGSNFGYSVHSSINEGHFKLTGNQKASLL